MSSDKSKYSIYSLDKKTPSYSGSSKSPISFAKMFIKNCNLKKKSITFYVKNCKNKKVYGPYLGNVNTKTVKLHKNKQRGGRVSINFNQGFLDPASGILEINLRFTINTEDKCGPISGSGNQEYGYIYCKKSIFSNNFDISTNVWSFGKFQLNTIQDAIISLMNKETSLMNDSRNYSSESFLRDDKDIKTMNSLNTPLALVEQDKLTEELERRNSSTISRELSLLYKKKAIRTAYDKLCKIYVDRHLSTVYPRITTSSFALLPNSSGAKYKISFSMTVKNPHIFFDNLKEIFQTRDPNTSRLIDIPVKLFFKYVIYKTIVGNIMIGYLKITGTYPDFRYEVIGFWDIKPYIPSRKNLVIIRDAISEYRRVYNKPTFARTIFNFVELNLSVPLPLE